jgi:hypothetical protein
MPANLMTPTVVGQEAKKELEPIGVTVNAHGQEWIENEKMGCLLGVAKGSGQPPVFLEMIYNGGKPGDAPIVIVGKKFLNIITYSLLSLSTNLFLVLLLESVLYFIRLNCLVLP